MGILGSKTEVWLATTQIKSYKEIYKKDLQEIFYVLAEHDDDFNGSNNIEGECNYNWKSTNKGGYSSNCEYLAEEILKDIKEGEALTYMQILKSIEKFLTEWTDNDNYYKGIAFETYITQDTLIVAVGVTTER